MHKYRTHNCNALSLDDVGSHVKLSGWIHRKRDHGSLLFIDLRDHYGFTQVICIDPHLIEQCQSLGLESVITITGQVVARSPETVNYDLATGAIEVQVRSCVVESSANPLPFLVNQEQEAPEELRLKYRFLELRREKLHHNIILRSNVIKELRRLMTEKGFQEFQTPILTASSPEGARDFLVPSRLHPGKFYALPQAPQQFKQLLMVAGFDRYFQIAPCFRDEDARADRSPGEFYQLDMEMAFATQQDVFDIMESVLHELFLKFGDSKTISDLPFPQLTYQQAMLQYGSDKPDLRNPIIIRDVTSIFAGSNFAIFSKAISNGAVVRAIPVPSAANQSRGFFADKVEFAMREGASGMAYLQIVKKEQREIKGPIAKGLNTDELEKIIEVCDLKDGDVVFFICDSLAKAAKIAGKVRTNLGESLELIEKDTYRFCWITDFPFYEWNEDNKCIAFSHNPFSMPRGELAALENARSTDDLLAITAYQYDIVCNGVELSSGAIRNHKPEIMYKAFELAGYSPEQVREKFGGMIKAFEYGAPPHGGIAPGVDRIVMLLADANNLREIIAFPLTQNAEDLLMNAPATVDDRQLQELHLSIKTPKNPQK